MPPTSAPRMRVGAIDGGLAWELGRVGHTVVDMHGPEDVAGVDLVILDVDGQPAARIEELAEQIAPFIRTGHMVVHTALGCGVQVLDSVEVAGAYVMAAHRIFGDFWVVSAADEIGETIAGLLVGELGGTATVVTDDQRPTLAVAQRLLALEAEVREDAYALLTPIIPAITFDPEDFLRIAERPPLHDATPAQLDTMHSAIDDPNAAMLFADLERRRAARRGDDDGELWWLDKKQR